MARTGMNNRSKGTVRKGAALVTGVALACMGLWLTGSAYEEAVAVPGNPGVPGAPIPVYAEDFSSGTPKVSGTSAPGKVNAYTGGPAALNQTYTADTPWLPSANGRCNGWILNSTTVMPTTANSGVDSTASGCNVAGGNSQSAWWWLQQMAHALGQAQGQAQGLTGAALTAFADANDAVSAETVGASGNDTQNAAAPIFLKTNSTNVPSYKGHYYAISAWFAQSHCAKDNPGVWYDGKFQFDLLVNNGVSVTAFTLAKNLSACTAAGAVKTQAMNGNTAVGPIYTSRLQSAALLIGANGSLGLQLLNNENHTSGNDVAFDMPEILDVTPQLDKAFTPSTIAAGQTTTLTFTFTNASLMLAKDGWTVTDTIPAGLSIVPGTWTTDCPAASAASVTPAPGTPSSITVTGQNVTIKGNLGDGQPYCTASVQLTSSTVGTYTNGPANLTLDGMLPPDDVTLTVVSNPAMTIVKTPTVTNSIGLPKSAITAAGDKVSYAMVVTNTGDVPMNNLTVTDPPADFSGKGALGPITCTPVAQGGTLAVGGTTTCKMSYTVTQADIDSGATNLTNTATATGTGLGSSTPTTVQDTAQVPITLTPHLSLDKSADVSKLTLGTPVNYSFLVTNDGNQTITNLMIDETVFTGRGTAPVPTCSVTTLAPGASTRCTATYAPTQADIDAGSVNNTAVARGKDPQSQPVNSDPDSVLLTTTPTPKLQLVKSAIGPLVVGTTVTYQFQVTNSGDVTVTNLAIVEGAFTGHGTIGPVTCPVTTLVPGQATTCTAQYTVLQSDVDQMTVHNTATATGKDPSGGAVVSNEDFYDLTAADNPILQLVKSGVPASVSTVGQTVTYTFAVTNSGNVTINNLEIEELEFTGSGPLIDLDNIDCPVTTLAPGESTNCTEEYAVTQADLDQGTIYNQAKAVGTDAHGHPVESTPDDFTVIATQLPTLTLAKSVVLNGPEKAGTSATYSFLVTNTGNVTLDGLTINDAGAYTNTTTPGFSGNNPLGAITCPVTTLAPGAQTTCTATYTLHQADVNAGVVNNTAQAAAMAPGATTATLSNPSPATIPLTRAPSLSLTKSVVMTGTAKAGSTLTYSFSVTNTGNVTLSNLAINDTGAWTSTTVPGFSGTGPVPTIVCALRMLPPGGSTTCQATDYVITQADVDAGVVHNTAVAQASDPSDSPVNSNPSAKDVLLPAAPALNLVKSVSPTSVSAAGDVVTYSFKLTNTGNVTLSALAVQENTFTGTGTQWAITCPVTSLAPGASTTCTSPYTATQADMDAGTTIHNQATASGTPPGSATPTVSNPSTADVTITQSPALQLTKSATPANTLVAGTNTTYTFAVKNTGNVTVTNLTIDDAGAYTDEVTPGFDGSNVMGAITCLKTTLAPGASTTCSALYAVSQLDVNRGTLDNTAVAKGTDPAGGAVDSNPSHVQIPQNRDPAVTLVKHHLAPPNPAAKGQTITFLFTFTNSGNVSLNADSVTLTDTLTGLSALTCPAFGTPWPVTGVVEPDQSVTCSATYTLTQADVDAGEVVNVEAVVHVNPVGSSTPVDSNPATDTVPLQTTSTLSLVKDSVSTPTKAGDTVSYTYLVTNTGKTTISALSVAETAFSGTGTRPVATCPVTTLAPDEHTTCTATYTVTQADVNAGSIVNTAVATGKDPAGDDVPSNPSTKTVPIPADPRLTLVKSATPNGLLTRGQVVTYSFAITNDGNVTITGLTVNDSGAYTNTTTPGFSGYGTLSAITCPKTTLQPTESTTCTATYTIVQADVDDGTLDNTAVASGKDPGGVTVNSNPDHLMLPEEQSPALVLNKTHVALPTGPNSTGQVVTFLFTVSNTGNETMDGTTLTFTDTMADLGPITCPAAGQAWPNAPAKTLAPMDSVVCSATYTLKQADIDAGHAINPKAVATANPVGSSTPVDSNEASDTVPLSGSDGLVLTKDSTSDPMKAGDTIAYTFTVANNGTTTVNGLSVADTAFSGTGTPPVITCPVTTLAPLAETVCTATYVVTQQDVDAGKVTNTAQASGTTVSGTIDSNESTKEVPIPADPKLSLVKTAAPTTVTADGQTVTYTYVAKNTGNVTLTGFAIDEVSFNGTGVMGALTCTPVAVGGTLAVGATTTCTATYTVSQSDIDAGDTITNTAKAEGTAPDATDPTYSNEDSADVTVTQTPDLTLVKSATPMTNLVVGAQVTYMFAVTNSGTVTVTNLAINDAGAYTSQTTPGFSGSGTMSAIVCAPTTLVPAATAICSATYTLTQADVDAGRLENTAVATGKDPQGVTVDSNPSHVMIPQNQNPSVGLTKGHLALTTPNAAGQTVTFTFTVTNTGNVTLDGSTLSIADTMTGLSAVTCPAAGQVWPAAPSQNLAPSKSVTCSATYVLTQADIDAGEVVNPQAIATITPVNSTTPIDSPPADDTVPLAGSDVLTLVKDSPSTPTKAGDTVNYTFTVTNDGDTTVNGLSVTDTAFSGTGTAPVITCPVTSLAPGDQTVCTASYTVTQADVDSGLLTNTAKASGTTVNGTVDSPPSTKEIPITPDPVLELTKTAAPATVDTAGQTITYTITVKNTGNVTVSNLAIDDTTFSGAGSLGAITCAAVPLGGTLPVGGQTVCTVTYTVLQADIDAGQPIANTATASGDDPNGDPVDSNPDSATVDVTSTPALTLVKSASPAGGLSLGETVSYSFKVTNSGNQTITNLVIKDSGAYTGTTVPGFSGHGTMSAITCPVTTLLPGATTTCTATYVIVQADVDAGVVDNTAVATGKDPNGDPVDSNPSHQGLSESQSPHVGLAKSHDAAPAPQKAGDTITFRFTVTNDGNMTLDGSTLTIADTMTDLSAVTCPGTGNTWPNAPATTLAPDDSVTCSATYTLKQADIDAGQAVNPQAIATITPVGSATPIDSDPATDTVPLAGSHGLTLAKTSTSTPVKAGDTIAYDFLVTNTGTVTATSVTIVEKGFTGTGTHPAPVCPVTTLAPGEHTTCTATYTVTQPDVDAGKVDNTAAATGSAADGTGTITSEDSSVDVPIPPDPSVTLTKSVSPTSVTGAGKAVTYTFVATNTGNVTLADFQIADTGAYLAAGTAPGFSGTGTLGTLACTPVAIGGSLAPNAVTTCTATYTTTQPDANAGQVLNRAVASGTAPGTANRTNSAPATAVLTIPSDASLGLVKTASRDGVLPSDPLEVGQTVKYSFVVTNTGNVTVSSLAIGETTFTGAGTPSAITCPVTTLAPLATTTCTGTYVVLLADLDSGGDLMNTAVATGKDPKDDPVESNPSSTELPSDPKPDITVVKTHTALPGTAHAGDPVSYAFTATNTGNVTLTDVTVTDDRGIAVTCAVWPGATGVLLPGETVNCTATYTLSLADLNAGVVDNTATASGQPPAAVSPDPVTDTSDDTLDLPAAPSLTITKQAGTTTLTAPGDIVYTMTVVNTGNVTLDPLTVTDPGPVGGTGTMGAVTCLATSLAPTASTTCTATYTAVQADIDALAQLKNTATATGKSPDGQTATDDDSATVPVDRTIDLTLDKTATPTQVTAPGNVAYTFAVTNSGNVTVSSLTIADAGPAGGTGTMTGITCKATVLAPGASTTCSATYAVTQKDLDKGLALVNTATASGVDPKDPTLTITSDPDSATVTPLQTPGLGLVKSVTPSTPYVLGDTLTYSFAVTNSGNVTITDLVVHDGGAYVNTTVPGFSGADALSAITCPATTLLPGAHTTCTAHYTVQQADIDAGVLDNTATVTGTDPLGATTTSQPSTAEVPAKQGPSLGITKTHEDPTEMKAGGKVTFDFVVKNDGDVTMYEVGVTDTMPGLPAVSCPAAGQSWPGVAGVLAPGQTVACTATYTLTQADLNAGKAVNPSAVAHGKPAGSDTPIDSPPKTDTVPLLSDASVDLVLTHDRNIFEAGDIITYTYTVTNTGNVTLSDLVITTTQFTGVGALSKILCDPTHLAPGEVAICHATYVATQTDVDRGHITNYAVAAGTPPKGLTADDGPVASPIRNVAEDPLPDPELTLVKLVAPNTPAALTVGQELTYAFLVTNSGNETIHNLAINETKFTGTGKMSTVTCLATTLKPGAATQCTGTYTVTQADVDAGVLDNTATASGLNPDDTPVTSEPSSVHLSHTPSPDIDLVKTHPAGAVGDTIVFSLVATNTGNTSLTAVTVTDPTAVSVACPTWPGPAGTLEPGESVTCQAVHAVTQADIDAGNVTNHAYVTSKSPSGGNVPDDATDKVLIPAKPGLTVVKTANVATVSRAGDTITYTFTVKNTGNVTATGLAIGEQAFTGTGTMTGTTCLATTLAPGAVTTCSATYTLTTADLAAKTIANTAVATAKDPSGKPMTSPPSSVTVTVQLEIITGGTSVPDNTGRLLWIGLGLIIAGALVASVRVIPARVRH